MYIDALERFQQGEKTSLLQVSNKQLSVLKKCVCTKKNYFDFVNLFDGVLYELWNAMKNLQESFSAPEKAFFERIHNLWSTMFYFKNPLVKMEKKKKKN